MNTLYTHVFGTLSLTRYPSFANSKAQQNLQAWDSADTLLLEHLHDTGINSKQRILILNDQFGALSCSVIQALSAQEQTHKPSIISQNDSFLSTTAITRNIKANDLPSTLAHLKSTDALEGHFDLVLIKLPKSLNLLEDQLYRLRTHVSADTKVVACAMVKNLSKNTRSIFDKILGTAEQSLAARKARLIHCTPTPEKWQGNSPFPRSFKSHGIELSCEANVFAEGRVDPGTHVFLNHLNALPKANTLIDLACGTGIMGILSAKACEANEALFCDESFMAIASTAKNTTQLKDVTSRCEAGNGIPEDFPKVDLIVCNPPFHQQQTTSTDIAMNMFKDAYSHLNTGGQFWVIANRHLAYHIPLKKLFGNCTNIAAHNKYVILTCTK